jgi:UDP-N-acetylmuramate dehydrogenase
MDWTAVINRLRSFMPQDGVLVNQSLKHFTTFRIGGPCDIMVFPENDEQTVRCIQTLREGGVPYLILGNGSNVLIHDSGIRGCVVKLLHKGDEVMVDELDHIMFVGAGESMMKVAEHAIDYGLSGMEFASGIPGSLGGTVFMNAGAYEHEMKDIVKSVRVLSTDGSVLDVDNAEMQFAYRKSAAQKNGWLILGATLQLSPDDPKAIRRRVDDFSRRRHEKQPLAYPSAGSAFKRPNGFYAAKLIDDAGLKGVRVGDAEVSELHAGFIINRGAGNVL